MRDSWARGNKPLAIVGPVYFTVTVTPLLEAFSLNPAASTVHRR